MINGWQRLCKRHRYSCKIKKLNEEDKECNKITHKENEEGMVRDMWRTLMIAYDAERCKVA